MSEQQAKALLQASNGAMLATHSVRQPLYPEQSVVPYLLTKDGLYLLLSQLARHTHNLQQNACCSLLILDSQADACRGQSLQEHARLSLMGDAKRVEDNKVERIASLYYREFPYAEGYHEKLDFYFYQFIPQDSHFIAGFARIHQIPPESLFS
jgi:putative heme iron utilization protein